MSDGINIQELENLIKADVMGWINSGIANAKLVGIVINYVPAPSEPTDTTLPNNVAFTNIVQVFIADQAFDQEVAINDNIIFGKKYGATAGDGSMVISICEASIAPSTPSPIGAILYNSAEQLAWYDAYGITTKLGSVTNLPGTLALSGVISPTQIAADTNDYAPTSFSAATVLRLTSDASRNVTGLAGGSAGLLKFIFNVGSFDIVFKDESGSSSAANRFALDGDLTLTPDTGAIIQYDATSSRWRLAGVGKTATGGGSGAPTTAQYVTLATDATLTAERVLTAGENITITDAGAGSTVTVAANIKHILTLSPLGNEPPSAAYATLDTRNAHPTLDFDGATDEEAVWSLVLPANYAGGGLSVDVYCSFTSATSGSVRWQGAIERMDASTLDIDADSFTALQSVGGTAPGTSGMLIKCTLTFTSGANMDSAAAGEMIRLKIRRDADGTSGTDDITTDAELLAVVVRET